MILTIDRSDVVRSPIDGAWRKARKVMGLVDDLPPQVTRYGRQVSSWLCQPPHPIAPTICTQTSSLSALTCRECKRISLIPC